MSPHAKRALAIATLLFVGPGSALADAIDGDWCLAASHFTIEGPRITTPAGNHVEGQYSRHGFIYTVPAQETGGGSRIDMVLLDEETLRLTRTLSGGAATPPETWKRCKPIS